MRSLQVLQNRYRASGNLLSCVKVKASSTFPRSSTGTEGHQIYKRKRKRGKTQTAGENDGKEKKRDESPKTCVSGMTA